MKLRLAALSGAVALAAVTGLATAGTASAATSPNGWWSCRNGDVSADGLNVHTCITGNGGNTLTAYAHTYGGNQTNITLCAEIVDVNQNVVPGSRNCGVVWGPNGTVYSNSVSLGGGTYYGVSYFTSPTFYYGGETPAAYVW